MKKGILKCLIIIGIVLIIIAVCYIYFIRPILSALAITDMLSGLDASDYIKYIEYDGHKYYADADIWIDNTIFLDDTGAFGHYINCTEVPAKINGKYNRNVIVYDGSDLFVFDKWTDSWYVKDGKDVYPAYTPNEIESMCIVFDDGSDRYSLTNDEIDILYYMSLQLQGSSEIIASWDDTPTNGKRGTIYVNYKSQPDSVMHAMFYFDATDDNIFLMSHTDNFGFRFGEYKSFKK